MNGQEPIRVLLELDPGADDALSGRISFEGRILEFSGWLRLIAVIEAARGLPHVGARPPPERAATTRSPVYETGHHDDPRQPAG